MKERLQKIHNASMEMLATTGMKFHHPEALKILKKNGIRVEGKVAYFTEDELLYWVRKAPHTFKIYAQNPIHDITVGGDHVNYVSGSGAPLISDKEGKRRSATIEDYVKLMKLFEGNDYFHVNGGNIVQPSDIPVQSTSPILFYTAITHSEKCMRIASGNEDQLNSLMEMAKIVYGGEEELKSKPRFLVVCSTNTPLQLDNVMTETLMAFAKYKQPVIIASAAMAGSTSPVTLAATIAMTNAEVLGAIALSQMINPGTPVIYGSQSTTSDLRNGAIAIGSPEGALCYKYCAQLAKFYGLPCRGGGALSDSKVVNAQAGMESMLTFMACNQNHMNLILHSAGILDGFACMSYEKVIVDFEVIDYTQRYLREFDIDDETIPLDVIDEVGHEGQYISELHTIQYCRKEPLTPHLAVRGNTNNPSAQYEENIAKRMNGIWDSYKKPECDPEKVEKLREILRKRGVTDELINRIDNM